MNTRKNLIDLLTKSFEEVAQVVAGYLACHGMERKEIERLMDLIWISYEHAEHGLDAIVPRKEMASEAQAGEICADALKDIITTLRKRRVDGME